MHLVFTPQLVEWLGRNMTRAQKLVRGYPLYERRLSGVLAGYEFARRVSRILQLKKKTGKEVSPPGRGSYLQSAQAEKAFEELIQWVRSFSGGDAVFDMAPDPPYLWYLNKDILETAPFGFLGRKENFGRAEHRGYSLGFFRESNLLKDF